METNFKIYDLITASVFILNVYVALLFCVRNFKVSTTHKLISFILFLLLLRTFSIHLYLSGHISTYPHFLLVSHLVSRIGLPILFLMLVFEVYQRKFKWYDCIHFLPALLFLANYWQFYGASASKKRELVSQMSSMGYDSVWSEGSFLSDDMVFLVRVLPFLFYVVAMPILFLKKRAQKRLSKSLKDFFIALIIYMVLNLVPVLFSKLYPLFSTNDVYEINTIGFATTLFLLVYFFFIPDFLFHSYFSSLPKTPKDTLAHSDSFLKIYRSRCDQIEQYFNLHKIFLNPDFTITQLEKEIKIPARQISKAIKLVRNQNFNQFINEYRMNHLLNKIPLEVVMTTPFSTLAYQIGFNSVNNFYAHFKSYVGCTPKVYFEKRSKSLQGIETPTFL